jgi:release factor glutamine methyltransferase
VVDEPLLELLRQLRACEYRFITVTPATHARVLRRPLDGRPSLRDIFGWNCPFTGSDLYPRLLSLLEAADALERNGDGLRSKVRVASLGDHLFLHSSYPTEQNNSVFFGPDTYRFVQFLQDKMADLRPPAWIVDMGAGTGAGGIFVRQRFRNSRVTLVDVNAAALELARINAAFAGTDVETVTSATIPHGADLIIANPPYIMDAARRTYRDGGDLLGGAVALDWTNKALAGMAEGGVLLLYCGVAYERGRAPLIDALQKVCDQGRATLTVEELEVDVFGEELENAAYATTERIAAIGAMISKARSVEPTASISNSATA